MMKICKLLCLILVFSFLFYTFVIPINAQETAQMPLSLSAQSAILMEAESGTVVCEKNAHTRLPMASTTKIMTAIIISQNCSYLLKYLWRKLWKLILDVVVVVLQR